MKTNAKTKIKTLVNLAKITRDERKKGKKIVLCHGVFDLIHPGHIRYFESAKRHGDILIVSLTADRFVKKGPGRPVFNEALRAEVLEAIELVDYVVIVESTSAVGVIKKIHPHVYVKGPDYKNRKPNPHVPQKLTEEEEAVKSVGGKLIFTDDIVYSSSQIINQHLEVYPAKTKAFLETFKTKFTDEFIVDSLSSLKSVPILVIGDTIIDQYAYSVPLGKSSKEPIVVHKYLDEESFAGGALATANHLAALSDNLTLLTVLGKRKSYETFIRTHMDKRVKLKFFTRPDAGTIVKRRYIDELTNQKLFQISYLHDALIPKNTEKAITSELGKTINSYEMVVVNDFGHGLLTDRLIKIICQKAKFLAVNVQANSANFGFNIVSKYPRADYLCVDEMELRLAAHDKYLDLRTIIKSIYQKLLCRNIIVTKGSQGSIGYSKQNGIIEVPAFTDKIVDRVGAGDALFSVTAPCMLIKMDPEITAFVGNAAAALKIQTVGNKTPIDFRELTKFITRLLK